MWFQLVVINTVLILMVTEDSRHISEFEIRECSTLGTNFVDVYRNGVLFAREVSRPIAETFCEFPHYYPNALADVEKLRTWMLEQWDDKVQKQLKGRSWKVK